MVTRSSGSQSEKQSEGSQTPNVSARPVSRSPSVSTAPETLLQVPKGPEDVDRDQEDYFPRAASPSPAELAMDGSPMESPPALAANIDNPTVSRQPTVTITWGPDRVHESEDERSLAKASAFAKRFERHYAKLVPARDTALALRSRLAHRQEVRRSKQGFLIESFTDAMRALDTIMANIDAVAAASPTLADSVQYLRILRSQADKDHAALQDEERVVRESEQQADAAERNLSRLQEPLSAAAKGLAENAAVLFNSDDVSLTASTEESHDGHSLSTDMPPAVENYLDKLGDQRIMQERFIDIQFDRQEVMSRRELLADQDQPVDPEEAARTDEEYSREYQSALADLQAADQEVDRAMAVCEGLGLNPEEWRATTSVPDEESSEPPTPLDVNTGTLSPANSQPPHRVPTTLIRSNQNPSSDLLKATERFNLTPPSLSSPQPVSSAPGDRVQKWIVDIEDPDPEFFQRETSPPPPEMLPPLPDIFEPLSVSDLRPNLPIRLQSEIHRTAVPIAPFPQVQSGAEAENMQSERQTPTVTEPFPQLSLPQLAIPEIAISGSERSPSYEGTYEGTSERPPSRSSRTDISSQPRTRGSLSQNSPIDVKSHWTLDGPSRPVDPGLLAASWQKAPARTEVSTESRPRTPSNSDVLSAHDSVTGLYSKIRFGPNPVHIDSQAQPHSTERWLLENGDRMGRHEEYKQASEPETQFQVGTVFETFAVSPSTSSNKALSNFTSNTKFKNTLTRAGKFVVMKSPIESQSNHGIVRGFEAAAIKTYGGRGVGKQGVVKAYHAIVYSSDRPPRPKPEERPQELDNGTWEAGMCAWPIHVVPIDPSLKLDTMSRIDFSDSMSFTFQLSARIIGRLDQASLGYLDAQYLAISYAMRLAKDATAQDLETVVRKVQHEMKSIPYPLSQEEDETQPSLDVKHDRSPQEERHPSLSITHDQLQHLVRHDQQAQSLAKLRAYLDFRPRSTTL